MTKIEVRRLTPADAALFREIRLEGLERDPDAFASTVEVESAQPLSSFEQRLEAAAVFGGFRGSELLGVAGFRLQPGPKHGHKGQLWGMYVRPAARQTGLGHKLVEAVIEHARGEVELLQLSVISENQPARRLYASLGFEEYGIERRAAKYRGRYHDDVLMAKMLVIESEGDAAGHGGECDR
ncbi:MAG: GNAT family N-acetyltransferase [Alphaproteobacteria bacterium]|nr:GNAT family N-acetyltransferase [Alphaproteobacteria bacterium]